MIPGAALVFTDGDTVYPALGGMERIMIPFYFDKLADRLFMSSVNWLGGLLEQGLGGWVRVTACVDHQDDIPSTNPRHRTATRSCGDVSKYVP